MASFPSPNGAGIYGEDLGQFFLRHPEFVTEIDQFIRKRRRGFRYLITEELGDGGQMFDHGRTHAAFPILNGSRMNSNLFGNLALEQVEF